MKEGGGMMKFGSALKKQKKKEKNKLKENTSKRECGWD